MCFGVYQYKKQGNNGAIMKKTLLTFLLVFLFPLNALGENLYVRSDGTAGDPDCSGSSACCAGSWDASDFNTAGK